MTPYALAPYLTRPNFKGATDKYSQYNGTFGVTQTNILQRAIRGEAPYDVFGGLISMDYRDTAVQRLANYRYQWRWYEGEGYDYPFEDGDRKAKFNFCNIIVGKGIDFFIAKGWTCTVKEGNEEIAQLLNDCWERNNRDTLTQELLEFAGVNGDCYVLVMPVKTDEDGNSLPRNDWWVRLQSIDPTFVFPFFNRNAPSEMDSVLIQFATNPPDLPQSTILFSLYITRDTFYTYQNGDLISQTPNPFGKINLVKIKNKHVAKSSFGESDLEHIIELNEQWNLIANSIRRVVKYQGEPTTLIYGARASDLERGAKKVWSNLPKYTDARVENLKLDGDLKDMQDERDKIEAKIYQKGEIPKIALDSEEQTKISNTSGIAMEMLFQSLITKVTRKRIQFTKGVKLINELILIASEQILGKDIQGLADDLDALYDSDVDYTDALPRDESAQIDIAIKKKEAGIWSVAETMRQCSGVDDLQRLTTELVADNIQSLAMAYENNRAILGKRPSMLAAVLGSVTLGQDLKAFVAKLVASNKKAKPPKPVPAPPPQPKPAPTYHIHMGGSNPTDKATAAVTKAKQAAKTVKPAATRKPKNRVRTAVAK